MSLFKVVYDTVDNNTLQRLQHTEYIIHDDNETFDIILEYLKMSYDDELYLVSIQRIDTNTYYIQHEA